MAWHFNHLEWLSVNGTTWWSQTLPGEGCGVVQKLLSAEELVGSVACCGLQCPALKDVSFGDGGISLREIHSHFVLSCKEPPPEDANKMLSRFDFVSNLPEFDDHSQGQKLNYFYLSFLYLCSVLCWVTETCSCSCADASFLLKAGVHVSQEKRISNVILWTTNLDSHYGHYVIGIGGSLFYLFTQNTPNITKTSPDSGTFRNRRRGRAAFIAISIACLWDWRHLDIFPSSLVCSALSCLMSAQKGLSWSACPLSLSMAVIRIGESGKSTTRTSLVFFFGFCWFHVH